MRSNLYRCVTTHQAARCCVATALFFAFAAPLRAQTDESAKYAAIIKDSKTQTGVFKTHQKDGKVYLEIASGNMNKDYIVAISIARGIAQGQLLGGMTWGYGDDWLWR